MSGVSAELMRPVIMGPIQRNLQLIPRLSSFVYSLCGKPPKLCHNESIQAYSTQLICFNQSGGRGHATTQCYRGDDGRSGLR